jgi:hypothetical protein
MPGPASTSPASKISATKQTQRGSCGPAIRPRQTIDLLSQNEPMKSTPSRMFSQEYRHHYFRGIHGMKISCVRRTANELRKYFEA